MWLHNFPYACCGSEQQEECLCSQNQELGIQWKFCLLTSWFWELSFFWCKLLKDRKLQLKYCRPTTEVYWQQWSTVPQWKYTDINGLLPHNRSILTSDINDPLFHKRTLEVYRLNGPLYHNKKYTDINSPLSHNRSIPTSMIHCLTIELKVELYWQCDSNDPLSHNWHCDNNTLEVYY